MKNNYSGWKNKATWQVNLWVEESGTMSQAEVVSHVGGAIMLEAHVRGNLIKWTKDELTDGMIEAGLNTVDWGELSGAYAEAYENTVNPFFQ